MVVLLTVFKLTLDRNTKKMQKVIIIIIIIMMMVAWLKIFSIMMRGNEVTTTLQRTSVCVCLCISSSVVSG